MRPEGLFWEYYSVFHKVQDLWKLVRFLCSVFHFSSSLLLFFSELIIKCVKGLSLLLESLAARDIRRR